MLRMISCAPARDFRRSILACAVLAAAVGVAVGDEVVINNPVERQPLQDLNATHERPLFSPTRRPPPPKVVTPVMGRQEQPSAPPAPPPSVIVLGIVSENGEARAMIRSVEKYPTDKVLRVRAGDDVGGWTVARIESRKLVLIQGERSADFMLFGAMDKAVKSADATPRSRRER
jgi:hypothetical protein